MMRNADVAMYVSKSNAIAGAASVRALLRKLAGASTLLLSGAFALAYSQNPARNIAASR